MINPSEADPLRPREIPHQAPLMFRARASGYRGLIPIIERELYDISQAGPELLKERYGSRTSYSQRLLGEVQVSLTDQQDVFKLVNSIWGTVLHRADHLGIRAEFDIPESPKE